MHNLGMRPFALNLPEDLVVRLDSVAAATDRSRSFVARSLLEQALADNSFRASPRRSGFSSPQDTQAADSVPGVEERGGTRDGAAVGHSAVSSPIQKEPA
jgi:hypothetical protein